MWKKNIEAFKEIFKVWLDSFFGILFLYTIIPSTLRSLHKSRQENYYASCFKAPKRLDHKRYIKAIKHEQPDEISMEIIVNRNLQIFLGKEWNNSWLTSSWLQILSSSLLPVFNAVYAWYTDFAKKPPLNKRFLILHHNIQWIT